MDEFEAREFVKENLSQQAIFSQLAEDAAELSAAASKMARILSGENPTPISPEEARAHFLEECGDVDDCIEILVTPAEEAIITDGRMKKFVRWATRIAKFKEMEV